ncbi:monovalent cation/H+ antiporter subunit D [Paracoccus sp. CPCC 101403]|uniref:Monovalent cation/H+ antiporter subunit D n=1 Tax=Paracoccus broussonetiae TaxID=3075834 RepID=A0ABU3EAZ9_9RHOB|nr:monovalent cation/H+ antiporter subunit D [Paracoccus sp. CPCC 101403]MDT1061315.1 monovalent cation/H+ antiporter subunit D [Paracoccus sp. CPCC 101403]
MNPETLPHHMIIAPILIPLVAGAIMLFYNDRNRQTKLLMGLVAVGLMFLSSTELMNDAKALTGDGKTIVQLYRLGDWPVPVGIVLVLDRLAAMMVMLTSLLAIPSLIYAAAGWHGKGQHYHSMFQFLLAGVNGAFLTGDLFNLFVFFEVMLAASYGLMLHGSGPDRIKAGLQYIAVNLAASLFFLIGVALVYGTTGSLNMADIAREVATLQGPQRLLFHAAAGFLGVAFLVKAAAWPLCFWLPSTYASASPPAAAIMAIMTKVGVYVIMRLSLLILGPEAGASAGFGAPVLMIGGVMTMAFGTVGVLGSPELARKGGYLAIVSSGTVLAAIGFAQAGGGPEILGGALYYLIGSTAAISAFFLMAEPVSRDDRGEVEPTEEAAREHLAERWDWTPMGLDSVEDTPGPSGMRTVSWLTMGICFSLIAAMLAGLPPMPGFIGKFAILSGAIRNNVGLNGQLPVMLWIFAAMLILSGLGALIGLVRVGIRRFWADDNPPPRIFALEVIPVVMLLGMILMMTVRADAVLNYTRQTAHVLIDPSIYRDAVLRDAERLDATPPQSFEPVATEDSKKQEDAE